jgi:N6-adenosine-specific RNA methylase IME4
MTVDEIAALPVAQLADDKAHLHLWTTNAFLPHAFRVVEAWGFEYRSLFVWCKPEMGLGNYWRVSHELLLLGVRGDCPFYDHSLRSWKEMTRRGKHSEKPEQVRHMIEKASPGPYLELFGRQAVKGWKVWGNQISRDLFTEVL